MKVHKELVGRTLHRVTVAALDWDEAMDLAIERVQSQVSSTWRLAKVYKVRGVEQVTRLSPDRYSVMVVVREVRPILK